MTRWEICCMNEMGILFKFVGALCVLTGSMLFGLYIGQRLEKKNEEYEGLLLVLKNLLRNQSYLKQSFPEIFLRSAHNLGKNNSTPTVILEETKHLGQVLLKQGFDPAWTTYVEHLTERLKLNDNIKHSLVQTGIVLQGMDEEGIVMQITQTMEILQEEILRQRGELKEKKKVGLSCSIMVGLFAVIILI